MNNHHLHHGYIALMTTVVLGLVLLTLTLVASNTGFFARAGVLDAQSKAFSRQAAYSCMRVAVEKITQNIFYPEEFGTILLGTYPESESALLCTVWPRGDETTPVSVSVAINNAYTNIQAMPDGSEQRECIYFSTTGDCVLP